MKLVSPENEKSDRPSNLADSTETDAEENAEENSEENSEENGERRAKMNAIEAGTSPEEPNATKNRRGNWSRNRSN